ncbi:MAG TPA: APC family permease [Verrucomicrobiae bacterium]|nr:APC family permease [Verrucomicrobiae bacterium]
MVDQSDLPAPKMGLQKRVRALLVGRALSPHDRSVFHKLSLIAFFAWVGLGADGLSSSCYGPQEAFLALRNYPDLCIFVGLASALTVFIISASYSQIIELFPSGGGGYLVASKLLSPTVGMVSGCALLIDYVLTITISIASGADALFSFLPASWLPYKLTFAILGVLALTLLNLRGVKESVVTLVPIFMVFVITHVFVIVYALVMHAGDFGQVVVATKTNVLQAHAELGLLGMLLLMLRAYSMGAGTYTGIEAVSNGLPILREPKVQTGKRTMFYMATSLAFTATGLMLAYQLLRVSYQEGKTLNAVLFETITAHWGAGARGFVLITLISEAMLLFVAAQAGFLDGPRVLSSMALDRWMPTKFATLSDRLVTQNGILLMGAAALGMMLLSAGRVEFLVVLYSINVFITFTLSQLGMVRHWWGAERGVEHRLKKTFINGLGLVLCAAILVLMTAIKFREGGAITIILTAGLIAVALIIRRHYIYTARLLRRLDDLCATAAAETGMSSDAVPKPAPECNPRAKTAVILVSGFNGLGLHTLYNVLRVFPAVFKNFVFVEVGIIDAGNFKGADEIGRLRTHVLEEVDRYVNHMHEHGYYAEGFYSLGTDAVEELANIAPKIVAKFPNTVFFGGQLVFPNDTLASRWLHNYTVFAVQKRFYRAGFPFVLLPIRV